MTSTTTPMIIADPVRFVSSSGILIAVFTNKNQAGAGVDPEPDRMNLNKTGGIVGGGRTKIESQGAG
jgi:hypothetical protein